VPSPDDFILKTVLSRKGTNTGNGLRTMSPRTIRKPFVWDLVSQPWPSLPGAELIFILVELLEKHMQKVSPSRMEELIQIFMRATELEIRFWDMGLSDQKV
jgi:hypothetical protein